MENTGHPSDIDDAAGARRPAARVASESVQTAQVMVDAFRLAHRVVDAKSILNGILDGVASLVQHDASGVYVIDADGKRLRHVMVRGCDPSVLELQAPFEGQGVVGQVIATGEPVAVTVATAGGGLEGRACARSRLVIPIVDPDHRVLGALDVWSDRPEGYDVQASRLLSVYGLAVAGAIENARLQAEVVDKRRLDSDLALARRVMDDLLPLTTPVMRGLDIAGSHESSLEVGGDYYEFIPLDEERWAVVIADVVGKGIAAALLVSALRASIASLAGHELAVRAIMRRANRFFHESVEEGRYVTLFYAVIDLATRHILYVNAGHVPPVLLRGNGNVELLEEGGVPLGLFEAPRYFEGHVALDDGDLLALYTDGVVETMDVEEMPYGLDRLVVRLQRSRGESATEICSGIMRDARHHGTASRQDDRTIVILKATADL